MRIIWSNFLRRSNEACIIPKAVEFQEKTFRDKTRMRILIFFLLAVLCLQLPFTFAQEAATTKAADPDPLVTAESDYILKDFHFVDGESLPELKLHYRTIGQPTSNPPAGGEESGPLNSRHYWYGKRVSRQRLARCDVRTRTTAGRGQVLPHPTRRYRTWRFE